MQRMEQDVDQRVDGKQKPGFEIKIHLFFSTAFSVMVEWIENTDLRELLSRRVYKTHQVAFVKSQETLLR